MKRFIYASVTALALVAVLSTAALANCGSCGPEAKHTHKAEAKQAAVTCDVAMGECCIASAKAGKGCCGKDAATVKANYASYKAACETSCTATQAATKAAYADMPECCATAVAAGKGCCGKDAKALKTSFDQKVAYHKASVSVKADMHKCCAGALAEGKGCCGKDADQLKASYEAKVEKASEKDMASL